MELADHILSQRGRVLLTYENFKFYKYRELKSNETCWCCTKRKCAAKLYTCGANYLFSRKSGVHNHAFLSEKVFNRQKISNSVKRKAAEDISERPAKLIHKELSTQKEVLTTLTTKDIVYIRNNVNRTKLKTIPTLPRSILEVHDFLNSIAIKTLQNEDFLWINNKSSNIVVFSCSNNIEVMCNSDTIYVDGTFDYCTKFFLQLFTIHAFTRNHYIPVAFCLLPNKLKSTYRQLFEEIKQKCCEMEWTFNPKNIVIDFEKAIHVGVLEVLPNVNIIGCRFHLAQAWWRKIQQLGLTLDYRDEESTIGNWIRHLFGLTFLNPDEVGDCFVFDFATDQPDDPRVTKFVDYLIDTYIDEASSFPPRIWAANTNSLTRTTNVCEAFHSKLNSYCCSPHPNIHVFVKTLENMQIDTYTRINSTKIYEERIINRKIKNKADFIGTKIKQYENKEISRAHFVKCVSHFCT